MKVTTVQYLFRALSSWKSFEIKVDQCVEIAAQNKAELLLFPEYLSSELHFLFLHETLEAQLEKLQEFLPKFLDLFKRLAKEHGLYICAGTFPTKVGSKFRNRSYFFAPSGAIDFQDKLHLTPDEQLSGILEAGDEIKVFSTPKAKVAIAICYDCEFPTICRKQVESGAELLLVPSFTETEAAFYRVHICSRARAIENQCFVMIATTLGASPWGEEIDTSFGSCGIFCPADKGFPSNGILNKGSDKEQLEFCHADLNFDLLQKLNKVK